MSTALASNTARLGAIARRDWRTAKRYQFRQMLQLLDFVYAAILAFYVGRLFETVPDELTQFGGEYFDFAMVGLAVMSVAGTRHRCVQRDHHARADARHARSPARHSDSGPGPPGRIARAAAGADSRRRRPLRRHRDRAVRQRPHAVGSAAGVPAVPADARVVLRVRDRRGERRRARQARRPGVRSVGAGDVGAERGVVPGVGVPRRSSSCSPVASRRTTASPVCARHCSAAADGARSVPTSPCSRCSSRSCSRCRCGSSDAPWPPRAAPASSATTDPGSRTSRHRSAGSSASVSLISSRNVPATSSRRAGSASCDSVQAGSRLSAAAPGNSSRSRPRSGDQRERREQRLQQRWTGLDPLQVAGSRGVFDQHHGGHVSMARHAELFEWDLHPVARVVWDRPAAPAGTRHSITVDQVTGDVERFGEPPRERRGRRRLR